MPKRTPEKKAPTRESRKVEITPEQLAEAKRRLPEVIQHYRASWIPDTRRREVDFKILGATIDENDIHLSVVITGVIDLPDKTATAKGQTIAIRVPAKVTARSANEEVPEYNDDFLPFPDLD
jgi:hypothetical protein